MVNGLLGNVGGRMIAGSLAGAGSCRCRPILLEWAMPRLIVAEQGCWDADLGGALVAALCSWKDAAGVAACEDTDAVEGFLHRRSLGLPWLGNSDRCLKMDVAAEDRRTTHLQDRAIASAGR
ncbi:hypothetical protein ACLOJK_037064 [Asimina triloba]